MTATIQISETEPTALLKDFSEFTAYLTHHPVILATAREFIGGRDLYALNEAMSEPVPETTIRTRQTLYPQLHLFYHLYAFFMDGESWSDDKFTSLHDEEGPHVDEARIGELGLSEGQRLLYLFDYGDQWLFQIAVEAIRKSGAQPRKPKVVGQKGKAPEQYEYY